VGSQTFLAQIALLIPEGWIVFIDHNFSFYFNLWLGYLKEN